MILWNVHDERITALELRPVRAADRETVGVTAPTASIRVSPITGCDVGRAAQFLHANLNSRITAEAWAASVETPWLVDRPNAGFMLLSDETVVGVHLALYSERVIDDRLEKFCNLGAWCVLPEHRFHSLRLLRALLSQEGYHFTDFSPSGRVIELNARLGFRSLETTTALVPNLPWPSWPGRATITSDPSVIERTLTGRQLELYRDHAATAAARHLLLTAGDEWCYVAFRKNRRARLPRLAFLLHVSHPEVFRRLARPLARHLLLHHGAIAMVAQDRVVEFRPRLSLTHRSGPRMFRSPHLQPAQIDYFYSELFSLKW